MCVQQECQIYKLIKQIEKKMENSFSNNQRTMALPSKINWNQPWKTGPGSNRNWGSTLNCSRYRTQISQQIRRCLSDRVSSNKSFIIKPIRSNPSGEHYLPLQRLGADLSWTKLEGKHTTARIDVLLAKRWASGREKSNKMCSHRLAVGDRRMDTTSTYSAASEPR